MEKIKTIPNLLKKFLKSKVAVLVALVAIASAGFIKTAKADNVYNFATAYQYYMLDNRQQETTQAAKSDDKKVVGKTIASLGSGGVQGQFSYSDMINSAPNGQQKVAKKFASMMATYSTFHYFSNKAQALDSIGPLIGRTLLMIVEFLPAAILDLVSTLIPALLSIVAKLNIVTFLGGMVTNMSFASDMRDALGISKSQFTAFTNALLTFLLVSILVSVGFTFYKGAQNVDRRHRNKMLGRLFTIVALPLAVGGSAYLIQDVGKLISQVPGNEGGGFEDYLIDDRSWAYNYNFAPSGNNADISDISPSHSGSYVDLSFDPYNNSGSGKDRIAAINKNSSLAGANSMFKNLSLLIAYGTSQTFSASDYINFQGSEESEHLLDGSGGPTYGSYYQYAQNMAKDGNLLKVDKAFYGSDTPMFDGAQEGPYKDAIDDYKIDKDKGKLNTSPSTAWRDRYIYGAKNAGDLDKYYNKEPSQEMVQGRVGGTHSSTVPSDQSMFLILSTVFDETGGKYSIMAPARGLKGSMAQFDSNRSDYYVVSMVGNPVFSVVGMNIQPMLTLVVMIALITALFSIGFVDMNLKPLVAFTKGATLGDIEYSGAFIIYSIGIAGTYLVFAAMPPLIIKILKMASDLIVKWVPTAAGMHPTTPQGSMALNGTTLFFQGAFAIGFALLWFKSPKFRTLLGSLFTYIWEWASTTGQKLEDQASGTSGNSQLVSQLYGKGNNKNKVANRLSRWQQVGKRLRGQEANDDQDEENPDTDLPSRLPDAVKSANDQDDEQNKGIVSADDIRRNGNYNRIDNDLSDIQNDSKLPSESVPAILKSQEAVDKFKDEATPENLEAAHNELNNLRTTLQNNGASEEQIQKVDEADQELSRAGATYGYEKEPIKTENVEERDNDEGKAELNDPAKQVVTPNSTVAGQKVVKSGNLDAKNGDRENPTSPDDAKKQNLAEGKKSVKTDQNGNKDKTKLSDKPDGLRTPDPAMQGNKVVKTENVAEKDNEERNPKLATNGASTNQKGNKVVKSTNIPNGHTTQKTEIPNSKRSGVVNPEMLGKKVVKTENVAEKDNEERNPKLATNGASTNQKGNKVVKSTNVPNGHVTQKTEIPNSKRSSAVNPVMVGKKVVKSNGVSTKKTQQGITRSNEKRTKANTRSSSNGTRRVIRTDNGSTRRSNVKSNDIRRTTSRTSTPVQRTTQLSNTRRTSRLQPRAVNTPKTTQKEVQTRIQRPIIQSARTKVIKDTQLRPVVSALGAASKDPKVRVALNNLRNSQNTSQMKQGIRELQKGVKALDPGTKKKINTRRLVKSLYDVQNSKSSNKDNIL